ncbi:ATP-binding cassette domain-containing protein [Rhodoblastus acidophilus]|uniref:ATP-binding cassette domain-containing protein n=1 Tax=Rhodoblastus acidophilus TaxID=1074 RepID=A0A6N8DN19_RHOAC|nr:peptidase domain-containing ABC transporter [Rhodoblastus acidophilus]MCW2275451.1 ATP-binding cassette subfamily B protein [Rhodoblastus acidophilus]MTV31992.1 ATP-binding cassette domain-containing protein [Rhodoblastus acidophilus]
MAAGASNLAALVLVARELEVSLSIEKLVDDNGLESPSVDSDTLLHCARRAGLRAKKVKLSWDGLAKLGRALPAIVELKNGNCLVLTGVRDNEHPVAFVRDPVGASDAETTIDRHRLEEAWTGEVVLVKRHYEIVDEEQPFSIRLIAALLWREKRLVRDLALSALLLGLLALSPIIFWRLLSDKVIYYHAMSTFNVLCLVMLVLTLTEAGLAFLRSYLLLVLTTRVDIRISEYMFDKVLRLPIDFFERSQVGMISRDMNEVWRIRQFMTGQMFGTMLDSMMLLFFLPVMFMFSPLLTFLVLGICALIAGWLLFMLPSYRRATWAVLEAEGKRGAFLIQTLQGIRTVKSLALEDRQQRSWDVQISQIAQLRQREGMVSAVIQAVVRPLERFAVTGVYAVGTYLALTTNDPVYVSALFAFLMLSQRVAGPLMQMAQLVNQYDEARSAVRIVANLVNQPRENISNGGVKKELDGHIQFSDLTFRYPGALNPALQKISFEVAAGMTLGVVGRSGSGKSTLTRLLQRLHSEYEGSIKIDGIDVREYDIAHLRRSLGIVLQENFLFTGTIRENITIAKPNASHDEMVRAARLAGAEEFIERLPRGYDTFIYEGSPNLSGGQRQRLAIARALIQDPRILILDEATSALDPDSEAIVNANIKKIAQGRTVIAISHRLSSLVNSDAILVLDRGRFLDMGTHRELLERCEVYSGLWSQQNDHVQAGAIPLQPRRALHAV